MSMHREMTHRVQIDITQTVRRSSNPPTFSAPYQHYVNCPPLPVHPERHPDPPRSHPRFDYLLTPPTSHPRTVVVPSLPPPPPRHHISDIERGLAHVRISRHSRSSSATSSNRSASPPFTRQISPSSSSSRSSSANSRHSARFPETPEYGPPERTHPYEYVSSRGMAYHRTEFRGKSGHSEREYADRETVVVEKTRMGGKERRRHPGPEHDSRLW